MAKAKLRNGMKSTIFAAFTMGLFVGAMITSFLWILDTKSPEATKMQEYYQVLKSQCNLSNSDPFVYTDKLPNGNFETYVLCQAR